MRYHEAMDKLLFKPLGMKNTFVFDYEKHHDTVSQTYKANRLRLAFDHLDLVYGDKNIYSGFNKTIFQSFSQSRN